MLLANLLHDSNLLRIISFVHDCYFILDYVYLLSLQLFVSYISDYISLSISQLFICWILYYIALTIVIFLLHFGLHFPHYHRYYLIISYFFYCILHHISLSSSPLLFRDHHLTSLASSSSHARPTLIDLHPGSSRQARVLRLVLNHLSRSAT